MGAFVESKIDKITMGKASVVVRKSDLRSSFRIGNAATHVDRTMGSNVSFVLHHRMQQLVNMTRARKYHRKPRVQEDITNLECHVA